MSTPSTATGLLASMVLDTGRSWGDTALDWQWQDAAAVLDSDPASPRMHFLLRARGMSKTTDVAAVATALLLAEAPPRSRSFAFAADQEQANVLLDSIVGLAERTGLSDLVTIQRSSITVKATGASLSIEPSDASSSFGRRPWLTVIDELAEWPDTGNHRRLWGAIISGLGKVPDSRLVVLSSAGSPAHPAFKRWQRAQESQFWRTSVRVGPSPWWSEADVQAATEQLTPTEVARYLRCEWSEPDDALATAADVAACTGDYQVLEPRPGVHYCMSLDIGLVRDSTVLSVGHVEVTSAGRQVVIDRVLRWTGSRLRPVSLSDVESSITAMWRLYHKPKFIYDPFQAAQLSERLKAAGIRAEQFTFTTSSVNKLARTLYSCLRDRSILLPDDDELIAELSNVRLVETGVGMVRLDHVAGAHDDQAVAVSMVAATLLDRSTGELTLTVAQGRIPQRARPLTALSTSDGPVEVVKPGEVPERVRGTVRQHFARSRGRPGYTPPRSR